MPKSIDTSSEFDFSNEPTPQQQPSNASVSSHSGSNQAAGDSHKDQQQQQQQKASNLTAVVAAAVVAAAATNCKKYRQNHQNFSKNIYIGTKNAEKWEKMRTVLSFKNDVEFVSYLLQLAEIDLADNNGCVFDYAESPSGSYSISLFTSCRLYARERFATKASLSTTNGGKMGKRGHHEKFIEEKDGDSLANSSTAFRAGSLEASISSLGSSLRGSCERTTKGAKKVKRVQFQDGK